MFGRGLAAMKREVHGQAYVTGLRERSSQVVTIAVRPIDSIQKCGTIKADVSIQIHRHASSQVVSFTLF